ncbi:phage tail protein [Ciceribacter ferrooxidans]|uniref:Phage tail protein n=1 Tax=Ciceribacter ferrooxidans TaxID=2509717 RepID=A0A4Q2T0Q9_9HYPH|nr:phage tail protein [Ciceribacter ferrooxidans]RYC10179.1 phage tail protein [Ciceribacter ferrooxidans]
MTEPIFGITIARDANEAATPSKAQMSVIGICMPITKATAALDADFTAAFPLDKLVRMNSNDAALLALCDPDGAFIDAVQGINAQLGSYQMAAELVVKRVAEGLDADETMANIVGSSATGTGIHAFLNAGAEVGVYPRIIICPGHTSAQDTPATANPVAAALPAVCEQILAVAIVDGPSTLAGFTDWVETLSSKRLIPVAGGVYAENSAGAAVLRAASPRIAGVAVRRDYENGGSPFRSWANQAIYGITAPERKLRFSLTDGTTEGQQILAAKGGIIVRGESGDDFAIADGGFVYIGTDNLSAETIWDQYHKVRGRDFIELTVLRTIRQYLGRFNLTTQTIQSVVNTIAAICDQRQSAGDILGSRSRFDPDKNNPADLRAGHIYVDLQFEEAPVFRRLSVTSRPYAAALTATINEIIARQDIL